MRILHVEDNSTDADLVHRALARTAPQAHVEVATSLAEARELLLRADRFELALLDLQLPDGSGLDLLVEIRERRLPLAVVMLTGSGDQRTAIAALQAGADGYAAKEIETYAALWPSLEDARRRFEGRGRESGRILRVLYAEPNAVDLDLTRRHLARTAPHIRLTAVPDAVLALSHLPPDASQSCDFDVVLLDFRLPGMDALEAARTIRSERGLDVPLVVVSGRGDEQVAALALQIGVDDYVAKHPGYLDQLAPILEKAYRQHALQVERQALEATSRHLSLMLEASPVVLYTLERRSTGPAATWVSSNIERLFGFSPAEALAPGWWDGRLHCEDREATLAWADGECGMGKGPWIREYRILDREGNVCWVHDELRRLDGEGPGRLLGAWRDITTQKRAERIQQVRLNALDDLVNGQALDQVIVRVADALEATMDGARVSVLLYDPVNDSLHTLAAPKLPDFYNAAVDGLRPAVGHGSCGTAAATGEAVVVEDVLVHPYWDAYRDITRRAGFRGCWSVPFKDAAGAVLGTFAIYHDRVKTPTAGEFELVDEFARIVGLAVARSRTETHLRQAAAVFDSTDQGILITDLDGRIVAVNRAYTEITGYTADEVLGRNPSMLKSGRQDPDFYQAMWAALLEHGHWRGEIWNRRKDGGLFPQLLNISTVRDSDGNPRHYVGMMTDITQVKESEANIERLAHYDPLTGLPNRLLTQSLVEHALEQCRRTGHGMAVLFLDLDRFKNVNDSLGHPSGDRLLCAIAERLGEGLRADDTLGRLGGDEFLVMLERCDRPEDAGNLAHALIGLLEKPITLPGLGEVYIGASIGISLFPQDGHEASQLIRHADAAMYQAKEHGRNTFRYYTPELTLAVNERLDLEARMRRALMNGEFLLHYQPQVEARSGRVIAAEALLRWNDPERGLVSPAEFVPLAEETGLIIPLGEWILQAACAQFREWIGAGLPPFCLSINLSGRQLQQPDIVERIEAALADNGLPPERIKLELTESMLMGRGEHATALLARIKALGVRLSIDDFGTGYSSLAYLKRFPIDELKIDRGFVRDLPEDSSDAEIAATIIAMARNLRLHVVAEGVETEAQAAFLAGQGCHAYQGYLFSRPLPAAAFADFLRAQG